jgi:XTP/dITP diphosphohydrolase
MKIVFATNNPNKLAEIKALVPDSIEIISLKEIGCYDELPETRDTLDGNALQKAEYVVNKYQIPCFSDDTGLLVDALNGEPGVYSARYAGLENSSEKNMNKLLKNLEGQNNRSASFETVVALILNGQNHIFKGSVVGEITVEKQGLDGFGYDPIFIPKNGKLTFAEMSKEAKGKISHRGRAVRKLITFLSTLED